MPLSITTLLNSLWFGGFPPKERWLKLEMSEVYTASFYNDYALTHETQIILQLYYIMIASGLTYLPWNFARWHCFKDNRTSIVFSQ